MPTPKVISNLGKTVIVQAGDTYEFVHNTVDEFGHVHARGSKLRVKEQSREIPRNEISESGVNWLCYTDYGLAVWAALENCIARGLLVKVGNKT